MKNFVLAGLFVAGVAIDLSAQPAIPCRPQAGIGVAAGLLTGDMPVDPLLAGGWSVLAATMGAGPDVSVDGLLPLAGAWSATGDLGVGAMRVVLKRDASGAYVHRPTGDLVSVRRVGVGLLRHRTGRGTCSYLGLSTGFYRFTYRGVSARVPGAAATMGLEFPLDGPRAVFIDVSASVALNEARRPLSPAGVVVNLRPVVGLRYRF